MLFQNLLAHIKYNHPGQDFKDLRGKKDLSIKSLFDYQVKKRVSADTYKVEEPNPKKQIKIAMKSM